ncbi:SDR family NAD(P)-dependent oxidoreductase [Photobacterium galatheae]|uniref:Dehydrogenase n=1 Tax=Photobacterium galatheae TaxID=1654360 RepID=A0A066S1N5_9GAMM|nr:SDR family oxidoreductase [Photobacterium galatheae]KDM93553.1 dehydrogenase [Photobacterium galatheae]MCM0151377.1 SDR family oxidoreductase [Photobacterium galatheae]
MKVALVTGGSQGIGLETVRRLVAENYQVITCSRREDVWQQQVERYPELAAVDYHQADISDEAQLYRLFSDISEQYGKLDVAVNNASPALASRGQFAEVVSVALQDTLQQDFWAQALCLQQELRLMGEGGAIVNLSSVNGLRPTPNAAMYSAAKHAIEGLTRSVALEVIGQGIRINAVAPGVTWTPRWEAREVEAPGTRADVSAVVPAKRYANASEIVDAVLFLLSEKASYIVGHTLVVDGGLSLN